MAKDIEDREEKKAREATKKVIKAKKRELNRQVAREAKAQAKIEAIEARKAIATTKKAKKAPKKALKISKSTRIVILKVGSTFLGNLGIKDEVEVKEVKDNRGVSLATTRRGKKVKLLARL